MVERPTIRITITRQCLMEGEVAEVGKTIEMDAHAARQLINAGKAIIEPIKTVEQKNIEIMLEQNLKAQTPNDDVVFSDDANHDDLSSEYDKLSLKQLQTKLNELNIPYHSRSSKLELLTLLPKQDAK